MRISKLNTIYLLFLGIIAISCSENFSDEGPQLEIRIEDSPADITQLNVAIKKIELHKDGDWKDIGMLSKIVPIMDYTGGESMVLFDDLVEPGHYTALRMHFNEAQGSIYYTTYDGGRSNLTVDKAYQYIDIPIDLEIGDSKRYLMCNLDVVKSIDMEEEKFTPSVTIVDYAQTGAIAGSIAQPEGSQDVETMLIETTDPAGGVRYTYTRPKYGSFFIRVPEGQYSITVIPQTESEFMTTSFGSDIKVINGELTNLGKLQLNKKPDTGTNFATKSTRD